MEKKFEALDEDALDEVTGGIVMNHGGAGIALGVKESLGAQADMARYVIDSGKAAGLNNRLGNLRVAGAAQPGVAHNAEKEIF